LGELFLVENLGVTDKTDFWQHDDNLRLLQQLCCCYNTERNLRKSIVKHSMSTTSICHLCSYCYLFSVSTLLTNEFVASKALYREMFCIKNYKSSLWTSFRSYVSHTFLLEVCWHV